MNRFVLSKIKFSRGTVLQIAFFALTCTLAYGAFVFFRNTTACWLPTKLPGIPPSDCEGGLRTILIPPTIEPQPVATATPTSLPPPANPLPSAWDGASRVNILFLGLDDRTETEYDGPPRSDTMILITVDPISQTAGMLSVPRDLWVNIPGFGYNRINTAYSDGEGNKLPGGGPGLAMKTVEKLLGVPVHYYVQVDFNTFVELVDMFGCIIVHPQETLILDPIGPGDDKLKITGGGQARQLCGGKKILAYARNRKTKGGDIDRARRQQEVILGLSQKIYDPEVFPTLIANAAQIYSRFSSGIHTNMSLDDAIKLAMLGRDIPLESVKTGVIDKTMWTSEEYGDTKPRASILKPIPDKIRVLRDEIFTASGPASPLIQNPNDSASIKEAMLAEGARVRVTDGTLTGLEQRAGVFFQEQGVPVVEIGLAPKVYSKTAIVVFGPKLYTLKYLLVTFGFSSNQIRFDPNPNSTVDIEIIVGADFAGRIP